MTDEPVVAQHLRVELPDGTTVRCPRRGDILMLWQEIFEYGVYADAASRLRHGDTVLDVGANVGLSAMYFARRAMGLRMLAFEPAREVFDCLSANLAEHVPSAVAYPGALGADTGSRELQYYPEAPSQSGFYAQPAADDELTRSYLRNEGIDDEEIGYLCAGLHVARPETVDVTTVSEIIRQQRLDRIDLLKIDAERAEMDVLAGIADAHWPRIGAVVAEVHDLDGRVDDCVRLLGAVGLTVSVCQEKWLAGSELYTVTGVRELKKRELG